MSPPESSASPEPGAAAAAARLGRARADGLLTLADERRLGRGLQRLTSGGRNRRGRRGRPGDADAVAAFVRDLDAAEDLLRRRVQARPDAITYPDQLPVAQELDALAAAIRDHQVVVVAGETGSGKTTQLPKLCLDLGRGIRGMIGHTQPRRIAARTVAERIGEELGTGLGGTVGYQVRFTDHTRDDTLLKVMTDGVLLAEAQRDPDLLRYDTLIIDEAHERSLNIDFLLGYLHRLLPRRPDLHLIITSATIDPGAFARHFGGAPVVEVSGRTYPVELRYRPRVDGDGDEDDEPRAGPLDQVSAVCAAVDELMAEPRGDILVFCSGEREIRDTAAALADMRLAGTEILPLYSRLSAAEQHKVFAAHALRRVVLATNVAETSVTVPGIRYVIDPGTARISRYSRRLKVQRLPVEAISQASADQRAGRCGRVAEGICIRLYSEDDYRGRPRFTEPEILRTSLASVILQMAALKLGPVSDFPFLDPPDNRDVTDGERLLFELGAFTADGGRGRSLTPVGRRLAELPLDPRLARMVLAAVDLGVLREVLVIVAGLTIVDPRERPAEKRDAADAMHVRYRKGAAADSDFLGWLQLWDHVRTSQKELSGSAFRRMCRTEFLHFLRIREWQDLEAQLRSMCRGMGLTIPSGRVRVDADPELVHRALLPGLLGHVGLRDRRRRHYDGARGATFWISPASTLFRRQPDWVMAAELVETTKVWAHTAAGVEPAWIEEAAGHLLKRSYSEPHWEARRGQVVAVERATLYGLPVVADRKVGYARIDPELSRELFIRRALVEGDWRTDHAFLRHNAEVVAEVQALEEKARRRDLLVDDDVIVEHYARLLPGDITSGAAFDHWWKQTRRKDPHLLDLTRDRLIRKDTAGLGEDAYPSQVDSGGLTYTLEYAFEPGTAQDGVTADIEVNVLNQARPETLGWRVPGMRADLVTALIRSLPKAKRRLFVPAPDTAAQILAGGFDPASDEVADRLAHELTRRSGTPVAAADFDLAALPEHLRVTYRVTEGGRTLATGKDLAALQDGLRTQVQQSLAGAAQGVERAGITRWDFPPIPVSVEVATGRSGTVIGYPALVDEGAAVAIRVLETPTAATEATWNGQRRLVLLTIPSPVRTVLGGLDNATKLALAQTAYGSATAFFDDAMTAAVDDLMRRHGAPVGDAEAFAHLCTAVRQDLVPTLLAALRDVAEIERRAGEVRTRLEAAAGHASPVLAPSIDDMLHHLAGLVAPGYLARAGVGRLPDLRRYIRGIEARLDKVAGSGGRDLVKLEVVTALEREYGSLLASVPADRTVPASVAAIAWMLQELRISQFAQTLRAPGPVSEKRIRTALAAGRREVEDLSRRPA